MRFGSLRLGLLFWLSAAILPHNLTAQTPVSSAAADPRHIDATHIGPPLNLNSAWLVHPGDDPHFADPACDDTHWITVSPTKPITSYGMPHIDRLWYRTHVRVAPGARDLALWMRGFAGSEQIFVNGTQVGSTGNFPPGGELLSDEFGRLSPIPNAILASRDLTIAVRASAGKFTQNKQNAAFLTDTVLLLGPLDVLRNAQTSFRFSEYTSNVVNIALEVLLFCIAVSLALVLRSDREYLALLLNTTFFCLNNAYSLFRVFHHSAGLSFGAGLIDIVLSGLGMISFYEFFRIVFGFRRSRLIVVWEWAWIPAMTLYMVLSRYGHSAAYPNWSKAVQIFAELLKQVIALPTGLGLLAAVVLVWRKNRNPDAPLFFVPIAFYSGTTIITGVLSVLYAFGLSRQAQLGRAPIPFFAVGWYEFDFFFATVTLLIFIVIRTLRIARERANLEAEIQAARSVQELLLHGASQATPGFVIDAVYRPAAEVGGDFFHICTDPGASAASGATPSLVAVVGDVSGKGLTAAMRVSMILGVLQRESSRNPASILSSLNEALLTQIEIGFTTACCVRLEASGRFIIANAGHIAPYISDGELATEPSLPLGLVSGQKYQLVEGRLRPGQHLLIISDGVLEARKATGELFGFERVSAMAARSATEVAETAQDFGQDDDITVVTLACAA